MFLFYRQSALTLLIIALSLITGCGERFQERLAPDPNLKENQNTSDTNVENSDVSNQVENKQNQSSDILDPPDQVPSKIPFYPKAELVNQEINPKTTSGNLVLTSVDSRKLVKEFYQEQLSTGNWKIVAPFSKTNDGKETLKAQLLNQSSGKQSSSLELTVAVSDATENSNKNSNIAMQYQVFSDKNSDKNQDRKKAKQPSSQTKTAKEFADLEKTPDPIEPYVRDVAKLGILTPSNSSNENSANNKTFAPNEVITRRTFARWLFKANNRFYDSPSQQIRPVQQAQTPAFQDVPPSDPDFPIIQGLAEAGIIPSRLSGNTTVANFRPDSALTRETLLLWKVPLDIRGNLPSTDVSTVKETWGFQDAGKIDPKALGAVVADFSKGEQSNFRRIYGYTQLFQPNKSVTRAEAATALWLFGKQGEAISAKQLIKNQ